MKGTSHVLLIVYNAAHFRELFRLAKLLQNSGQHTPLMLFVSPYPTLAEHYQECLSVGIKAWIRGQRLKHSRTRSLAPFFLPVSVLLTAVRAFLRTILPSSIRRLLSRPVVFLKEWILFYKTWLVSYIIRMKPQLYARLQSSDSVFLHFIRCYRQLRYARLVCSALRPDLVVLAEDNVEYMSGAWVRSAHKLNIPVLIVPYCLAGLEEPAAVYYNDPRHQLDTLANRFLARHYPQWIYEYKGRKLVRMPASRALPLEWLGISSPLPWLMNGTYADVIAVESPFMRDFYRRQGLSSRQLVITGTASDDVMYESLCNCRTYRNRLYAHYGMQLDRPMILCALPPVTSAMSMLGEEFSSYQDMLRFWLESLKEVEGYNIFISLHPTMHLSDFDFLDEGGWWGLAIAPPDTAQMIALCDIYIASVSSTIRWAIACGKPVINYDVYRFRFPDFRPALGVVTVESKRDFIEVLQRMTTDVKYYESLREAQIECRSYWGMIDGKSNTRLLSLIESLTSSSNLCICRTKSKGPTSFVVQHAAERAA